MQITTIHKKLADLIEVATKKQQQVQETRVAFYFRIFDAKGACTSIDIFYKP